MLVGSYNYSDSGVSCAIVSRDSEILDISFKKYNRDANKKDIVLDITESLSRLVSKHRGSEEETLFMFPNVLKGDIQQQVAFNSVSETAQQYLSYDESSFYMTNAFCNMLRDDTLNRAAYNTITEPITIYTDASVSENKKSTLGYALVTDDDLLLQFGAQKIDDIRYISRCELRAGILGLAQAKNFDSVHWVSDNQDAQAVLKGSSDTGTQTERNRIREYVCDFDTFSYEDIKGRNNVLADALADDVRIPHFNYKISYKSPALQTL